MGFKTPKCEVCGKFVKRGILNCSRHLSKCKTIKYSADNVSYLIEQIKSFKIDKQL